MAHLRTFELLRIILLVIFAALLLQIPLNWFLFGSRANITPCTVSVGSEVGSEMPITVVNVTNLRQGTAGLHHKLDDEDLNGLSEFNDQISEREREADFLDDQPPLGRATVDVLVETEDEEPYEEASPYRLHPQGLAHFFFVQFSAHRFSSKVFFIVGLTSQVALRFDRPVHQCEWHQSSSGIPLSVDSELIVRVDAEVLNAEGNETGSYATTVLKCAFKEDVGADGIGGLLFLTVPSGAEPGMVQRVLALREKKGGAAIARVSRRKQPPFKYAFCGSPITSSIRMEWIRQWLAYHLQVWEDNVYFFFYDLGGLKPRDRKLFDPFIKKKVLTITSVQDAHLYPGWRNNRLLFNNDCLHRSRFISNWTFFLDFDEFLNVLPPANISAILEPYRESPYVSFGSVLADPSHCTNARNDLEWPIQRMLWRQQRPLCDREDINPWKCPGSIGHRKFALSPQKVFCTGQNGPAELRGVDIDATVARVHHYRGVLIPYVALCAHIVDTSVPLENRAHPEYFDQYVQDTSVPGMVTRVRNSSLLTTYRGRG